MENRYLYKAKRLDNEEWVQGNLIVNNRDDEVYIGAYEPKENVLGLEWNIYIVDPKTLCQCTGLKDGGGNLVWENDIVRLILADGEIRYFKVSFKKVVRKVLCHPDFDDAVAKVELNAVCFEWNGYELFPCIDEYGISDVAKMERAGNIFDNPELLEV